MANAQYYKMDGSAFSFSSVDWRGYKYMGLADGFTLFNGNQNGYNSDSTLTWNGITPFSIYGLQAMAPQALRATSSLRLQAMAPQ